jgi:N-acetyl-gamma-glutamyl-phosphate reductase
MTKIKAGIIGAAGYTGGELARILINHPYAQICFAHSKSNAGKFLYEIHEDLLGETDLKFIDPKILPWGEDEGGRVLFLCAGHGEAKKFLDENASALDGVKIIDLSHDYRLHENGQRPTVNGHPFIYGLPELNRDQIRSAQHIANPGCFATAIQLGLLPLAHAGLLGEVHTTGITGSTGAGQSLSATSHFSWRANNIQAYKTLTHQHIKEVTQSLQQLQPSFSPGNEAEQGDLNFVPWRGDFTRGIFISSQLNCELDATELVELYNSFYEGHPFTSVSSKPIFLKQIVNTNKCVIQLEKIGKKLVVHSALDNLLKGASGQAVQNMNLAFGIDEEAGLRFKAVSF